MTINKKLLLDVLAKIEADPKSWDQGYWFCGTAACFAGHACLLSGDKPIFEEEENEDGDIVVDDRAEYVDVAGVSEYVSDRAGALLGISEAQADVLFDASNSLEDLQRFVGQLVTDKPLTDENGVEYDMDPAL